MEALLKENCTKARNSTNTDRASGSIKFTEKVSGYHRYAAVVSARVEEYPAIQLFPGGAL